MKEVRLRGLSRAEMGAAQNEVAVLKKVRHKHAIAIEDALIVDDTLCIVMEYADGKDLDSLIKQRKQQGRPFTEDEVLKIFWQLTSVLGAPRPPSEAHAHAAVSVHAHVAIRSPRSRTLIRPPAHRV